MSTLSHIIFKCTLQTLDCALTVDDRIHLKIQPEASDIHISCSHTGHHAVHAQCLCMQESVVIHITFCTGSHHVSDI